MARTHLLTGEDVEIASMHGGAASFLLHLVAWVGRVAVAMSEVVGRIRTGR